MVVSFGKIPSTTYCNEKNKPIPTLRQMTFKHFDNKQRFLFLLNGARKSFDIVEHDSMTKAKKKQQEVTRKKISVVKKTNSVKPIKKK